MLARLQPLAGEPRPPGCEKLDDVIYRVRAGDIRIVYRVDDGRRRVDFGAVRRRPETTYRNVGQLLR